MEIANFQHGALIMAWLRGKSRSAVRRCLVLLILASALDFMAPSINARLMLNESKRRAVSAFRVCPIAGS